MTCPRRKLGENQLLVLEYRRSLYLGLAVITLFCDIRMEENNVLVGEKSTLVDNNNNDIIDIIQTSFR
ncbi:hypothetical protein Glove_120g72 [Diversispora epigaea]|uniref:Uncharacterized protein n=1 Tax=Diversispora epigaea TaxID=1348612 RepID=A0A397J397_9GLOM|nr:hypothetical protein Glove_120g72 [Diversispora epigaea]